MLWDASDLHKIITYLCENSPFRFSDEDRLISLLSGVASPTPSPLVYVIGSVWCGSSVHNTGCSLYIYLQHYTTYIHPVSSYTSDHFNRSYPSLPFFPLHPHAWSSGQSTRGVAEVGRTPRLTSWMASSLTDAISAHFPLHFTPQSGVILVLSLWLVQWPLTSCRNSSDVVASLTASLLAHCTPLFWDQIWTYLTENISATEHDIKNSKKNLSIYRDFLHSRQIRWNLVQKRLRTIGEFLPNPLNFRIGRHFAGRATPWLCHAF